MDENYYEQRRNLGIRLNLARKGYVLYHKKMNQYIIKRSYAIGWTNDYLHEFRINEQNISIAWQRYLLEIHEIKKDIAQLWDNMI